LSLRIFDLHALTRFGTYLVMLSQSNRRYWQHDTLIGAR